MVVGFYLFIKWNSEPDIGTKKKIGVDIKKKYV